MRNQEIIRWHSIVQEILDRYLPLMSGKEITKGEREYSKYVHVDYYCEAGADLPANDVHGSMIRPFDHLKRRNVIEYKSLYEPLSERAFRHYVMRALAVETPDSKTSYQGEVTLTIFTTRVPKRLLAIKAYGIHPVSRWKYRSDFFKDLEIVILIQRGMRDIQGGEALALLQILEGNKAKQRDVWQKVLSQDLENIEIVKQILQRIGKEAYMNLVAELKKEGKIEGRTEGRIEGRIEGKIEAARNMLKEGLSVDLIYRITGLSHDDIKKLTKNK